MKVPYQRPLLPTADKIAPYLERIDDNRYYSNSGHLVLEFEQRLADLFGAPCVTASSATSALTACLLALDLPKGSFIACPSWTFVATPASIVAAGHIPYFFDCCEDGISTVASATWDCSAIVLVAPFGAPVGSSKLLSGYINIPILIDAAAGFDAFSTVCKPGKIPVVISTHATKTFGTGEGGFVTCSDEPFLKRVRNILNFGMNEKREIETCGLNGKMSEYHAAVGLAGLDEWKSKRIDWIQKKLWYAGEITCHHIAQSTMAVRLNVPAAPIVEKLVAHGIEAKHGLYGCHTKDAFKNYPRTSLSITEDLIDKTVYLPFSVDLREEEIHYVCKTLREIL
jgi:dTDP-4-amino-4,6-dideoxygalactose transaminase